MSSAHDLLAWSAPGALRAVIDAETVVELVAPRWRWRIITPGQWRVLSRLGRRTRVRDLVGSADAAAAADVVDRVLELVQAGLCVLEEVPRPTVDDVETTPPEPHRRVIAVLPGPDAPARAVEAEPRPEPPVSVPAPDAGSSPRPDEDVPEDPADDDAGADVAGGPVADPAADTADETADEAADAADDELGVLPRREPGRTISPVAAILRQRHEQGRRADEEAFRGPDTEILRRLLGSLQHLEDAAPLEHGTDG